MTKQSDFVEFSSLPKFYDKEKSGLKNNTIRVIDKDDERFRLVNLWAIKKKYGYIRIRNTETKEFFEREIKDISFYNYMWIISWFASDYCSRCHSEMS